MTQIIWVSLSILFLFLLFIFLKETIKRKFKLKVCAICIAVSLTWLTLLILKFNGFVIDNLLLGILMGESVVGIMYLFEKKVKEVGIRKLLWLKIFIIIFGTLFVYLLLSEFYGLVFWLVISLSIIILIYVIFSMKSSTKKENKWIVKNKYGKFSEEIKKLEEKFEHCCD